LIPQGKRLSSLIVLCVGKQKEKPKLIDFKSESYNRREDFEETLN